MSIMLSISRSSQRQLQHYWHSASAQCRRSFSGGTSMRSAEPNMEEAFEAACAAKTIPGAVLVAADTTGRFNYSNAFGLRSLQSDRTEPLTVDSIMAVRSCTKLLTSIAAMQCVERGLVTLDEDVRPILHELNDIEIITSAENGSTETHRNKFPVTLRQLLTHTSGFGYEFNDPLLQQWRSNQAEPPIMTVVGRYKHPLRYDPGTNWSYGPSTDWAGLLVERVSKVKSLEEYMAQNIWEPLGITDMTFFLSKRPDLHDKIMSMSFREQARPDVTHAAQAIQHSFQPDMEDAQGGGGIFTSASEYIKVLQALLRATDFSASDSKVIPSAQLLRRSTANDMFLPQLKPAAIDTLQAASNIPQLNRMLGGMPVKTSKNWGLGGMLVMESLPGWRGKGTLTWGGMPNLTWWIDRDAGLCGLYATQLLPIGDEKTVEMTHLFEKTMYERHTRAIKT